jgi:hypothetical protein
MVLGAAFTLDVPRSPTRGRTTRGRAVTNHGPLDSRQIHELRNIQGKIKVNGKWQSPHRRARTPEQTPEPTGPRRSPRRRVLSQRGMHYLDSQKRQVSCSPTRNRRVSRPTAPRSVARSRAVTCQVPMQSLVSPLHNSPPPYTEHVSPLRESRAPRVPPISPQVLCDPAYVPPKYDFPVGVPAVPTVNPYWLQFSEWSSNESPYAHFGDAGQQNHRSREPTPHDARSTEGDYGGLYPQSLSYSGAPDEHDNNLYAQYLNYQTSPPASRSSLPPVEPFPTY